MCFGYEKCFYLDCINVQMNRLSVTCCDLCSTDRRRQVGCHERSEYKPTVGGREKIMVLFRGPDQLRRRIRIGESESECYPRRRSQAGGGKLLMEMDVV